MNKQALVIATGAALVSVLLPAQQTAFSQGSNDFFGAAGSGNPNQTIPGTQAAEQALNSSPADYTADEKRMQKKYKANIVLAQRLIQKGERMMQEGQRRKDDKSHKKGKILKEIGEKRLAQLKENNPLPEATR